MKRFLTIWAFSLIGISMTTAGSGDHPGDEDAKVYKRNFSIGASYSYCSSTEGLNFEGEKFEYDGKLSFNREVIWASYTAFRDINAIGSKWNYNIGGSVDLAQYSFKPDMPTPTNDGWDASGLQSIYLRGAFSTRNFLDSKLGLNATLGFQYDLAKDPDNTNYQERSLTDLQNAFTTGFRASYPLTNKIKAFINADYILALEGEREFDNGVVKQTIKFNEGNWYSLGGGFNYNAELNEDVDLDVNLSFLHICKGHQTFDGNEIDNSEIHLNSIIPTISANFKKPGLRIGVSGSNAMEYNAIRKGIINFGGENTDKPNVAFTAFARLSF